MATPKLNKKVSTLVLELFSGIFQAKKANPKGVANKLFSKFFPNGGALVGGGGGGFPVSTFNFEKVIFLIDYV